MSRSQWRIGLVCLAALALLPMIGHWARRDRAGRCALDGVKIEPLYAVRVRDAEGADRDFCCPICAELWLGRQAAPPRIIYVTDETTGDRLDARRAFFVRSSVVTVPTTGSRVHAFAAEADAVRHADAARGHLLEGEERPFARWKLSDAP
jgi:hypothetical protein